MIKKIKNLIIELAVNGKGLSAWILNTIPGVTDFPGLKTALETFIADPNKQTGTNLAFQLFWTFASGHRALKILKSL